MDDLKKKKIEKTNKIVDDVFDNMSKAVQQLDLKHLYERKIHIEKRINETKGITKSNLKLQLSEIDKSIKLLEENVSLQDEYDFDVDEEAARRFLSENDLEIQFDEVDFIEQNDILDQLEKDLGIKKE